MHGQESKMVAPLYYWYYHSDADTVLSLLDMVHEVYRFVSFC